MIEPTRIEDPSCQLYFQGSRNLPNQKWLTSQHRLHLNGPKTKAVLQCFHGFVPFNR